MHHSNSFPSGHASTFFVFCTCCALFLAYRHRSRVKQESRRKLILFDASLLLLLVLAALGAYSRVYLSQHFLSDVCVGSIIGFATPCLMFYFCRKSKRWQKYWQTQFPRSSQSIPTYLPLLFIQKVRNKSLQTGKQLPSCSLITLPLNKFIICESWATSVCRVSKSDKRVSKLAKFNV